ncbi:MAG: hypothetical protein I4N51_06925 [Acinetobacter sp.]|nr:hypothetical protein [Acinetobacter sp.]
MAESKTLNDIEVQCKKPIMKDASTQYHDEIFEKVSMDVYRKLNHLSKDQLGLGILKHIYDVSPRDPIELSNTFIEAVHKQFNMLTQSVHPDYKSF